MQVISKLHDIHKNLNAHQMNNPARVKMHFKCNRVPAPPNKTQVFMIRSLSNSDAEIYDFPNYKTSLAIITIKKRVYRFLVLVHFWGEILLSHYKPIKL